MEATLTMNQNSHQKSAEPLHIQRLEACLDIGPFMKYAQEILSRPLTSSDDSDSDVNPDMLGPGDRVVNGVVSSQSGILFQIGTLGRRCVILDYRSPIRQKYDVQFHECWK